VLALPGLVPTGDEPGLAGNIEVGGHAFKSK
jgi:hypothetical protein